jgi:cobalt-zinc-cadmium efflux system outer membrane protein
MLAWWLRGQSLAADDTRTIDSVVAEVLQSNPELKFYEAEITAAKAGRKAAGLFANPELSASAGQKTVRGPGLRDEGMAWSVGLMQPFEWPGRLGLRKAIANQDIQLAELGLARFKLALASRTRHLAFRVVAAREHSAAATEVAGRFQTLREVLVQRDPAGLTPLLETRVIEATELNFRRKAGEAELAAKSALLELNQLRAVALDTKLPIETPTLAFHPLASLPALTTIAFTNNFDVRVRVAELAQQGFRVSLAANERFPAVTIGPMISEERAGDRERTIGVGISIPLPLWNRNSAGIETAKVRQAQAETSLFVTQREVERKLAEAALTYEAKTHEMANWRPDAVQHFREAAELADRHYRLGAVPVATYVELQKQYLEAVESLFWTKQEALAAAGQIELLTGLPLSAGSVTTVEEKP